MAHKILTCFLILYSSTSIDISFLWGFHGKNFFSVVTSAGLQNRISLLSSPQNNDFGSPPGVSITFWESESPVKKFCPTPGANNSKNVCIEEGKMNSFTFLCQSFPNYCGLVPGKIHVKCNASHRGKWNCMSECLVSPAIRNVHFFLTLPRLLRWSEKLRGYERLGSLPGLRTHQSNATNHFVILPAKQFVDSIRIPTISLGTSSADPSEWPQVSPMLRVPHPHHSALPPWPTEMYPSVHCHGKRELASAEIGPISVGLEEYSQTNISGLGTRENEWETLNMWLALWDQK